MSGTGLRDVDFTSSPDADGVVVAPNGSSCVVTDDGPPAPAVINNIWVVCLRMPFLYLTIIQ